MAKQVVESVHEMAATARMSNAAGAELFANSRPGQWSWRETPLFSTKVSGRRDRAGGTTPAIQQEELVAHAMDVSSEGGSPSAAAAVQLWPASVVTSTPAPAASCSVALPRAVARQSEAVLHQIEVTGPIPAGKVAEDQVEPPSVL